MTTLIVGSVLAVLGLGWVLWPLLRGELAPLAVQSVADLPEQASAIDALREIEFDRATGKLSDEDYAALKATYTPAALAELRARDGASGARAALDEAVGVDPSVDPAERIIRLARERKRACSTHGPRPESDAWFCSDCGEFLGAACLHCGAPAVSGPARFCTGCGRGLAA